MNELGLPTPGLYSKRKNTVVGGNAIIAPESEILWNPGIVWRVLRRYEYTGALVMGRRQKLDVNTTAFRTLPEDKWIITENTHEAIVTKDEYYLYDDQTMKVEFNCEDVIRRALEKYGA